MKQVTRVATEKIAVVFDFDETLTPRDSFAVLLENSGFDAEEIKSSKIQSLVEEGWEKYLARAYTTVQLSRQRSSPITQDTLIKTGQTIQLYEGAETLFERLQDQIHSVGSDIELEFYLISGGFVDIPRNTAIAKNFKHMWGCEFHYDETGAVDFIKKQMTHTEKTRYLYYLSRGIEASDNEKDLIYNYADLPKEDLYIPLDQVIYVGDGASDIPCFAAIKEHGGMSIGIYPSDRSAKDWKYMEKISQTQRLSNLVPAGYEDDSELVRSLSLCVECIATQIKLRQLREKGE